MVGHSVIYTKGQLPPAVGQAAVGKTTGEHELVAVPRLGAGGRPLVLALHGANGSGLDHADPAATGQFAIFHALAEKYAVIATDMGGAQTWGTDVVLDRFDALLEWAATNIPSCSTASVYIWGASMGNYNALRIAADRPTKVRAVSACIPACDAEDMRVRNPMGSRGFIDTAWGIVYPAAIPARGNMLARAQAGELAGLPWKGFIASGDTVCTPANVAALVTAIGATASSVVVSSGDHTQAAIAATNPADVLSFFAAH